MKILIILISFVVYLIVLTLFERLYYKTGIGKWFYHDILKEHVPDDDYSYDGFSLHSHCKHCGKEIRKDSHGNWF